MFNLNFPFLNFLSFALITLPVCLPKQFFSINGVYSLQISTDYFHICPHAVLYFRQTLLSFMIFPCKLITPDIMTLLWTLSSHRDGGLRSQHTLPEAVKAARVTCVVSTLAHSQRGNFQPVLNFKHMSNPTCFAEITHALKIKPCSATVLEWDQRALSILHQAH